MDLGHSDANAQLVTNHCTEIAVPDTLAKLMSIKVLATLKFEVMLPRSAQQPK